MSKIKGAEVKLKQIEREMSHILAERVIIQRKTDELIPSIQKIAESSKSAEARELAKRWLALANKNA